MKRIFPARLFAIRGEESDKRILFTNAIIIFSIASIAAFLGFAVSVKQTQQTIRDYLQESLANKIQVLEDNIQQASQEIKYIIKNPNESNTEMLLDTSLTAIQISDNKGNVLYSAGKLIPLQPETIPLFVPPYQAALTWNNGFNLRLAAQAMRHNKPVTITAEWPLEDFNALFSRKDKNKELFFCYANNTSVSCLPHNEDIDTLNSQINAVNKQQLGQHIQQSNPGFVKLTDKHNDTSLLAYQPLQLLHTGLLIKSNLRSIYHPLYKELLIVAPLFILTIIIGALLLYYRILPLLRHIILAKDKALAAEKHAQDSEARFILAFNSSAIGMALLSVEGYFTQVNPALCDIYGYAENELLNLHFKDITYTEDLAYCNEKFKVLASGQLSNLKIEKRYCRKDGHIIWALVNLAAMRGLDKKPLYYMAQIQDISAQKIAEAELNYQANHDTLTGLANRAKLEEGLAQSIELAKRNKSLFAVFFLDLDKFKDINDNYGHEAGDKLLKTMAERLHACARKSDIIARIGGDEFILVLNDLSNYNDATDFAERILTALLKPITIKEHPLFISTSIGISFYPADGSDISTLLKSADNALYKAKELGRNNYQFAQHELSSQIHDRKAFETDLEAALENNEFQLYYLPQYNPSLKNITGVEALLRWNSKQHGLITPEHIIPLAEESGIIIPLSDWIIRTACEQVKRLQNNGYPTLKLATNISVRQFMSNQLIHSIENSLAITEFSPNSLSLEINETLIMQDPTITHRTISALRKHGINMIIDNFGTGYSSLTHLQDYAVNAIKIDRSLIRHISTDSERVKLILAIIAFAKNLGVRVIAEGVETKEQFTFLSSHGCDEIQGYYISKPVALDSLMELLKAQDNITAH